MGLSPGGWSCGNARPRWEPMGAFLAERRALRGLGDGPSALPERVCACVCTRVCGVVCVLGSGGSCCLAEEPPQRPDLLLVCWRLWRQLLLLAPGLRCGRLNFLLLASGRQAATGCLRQGLPSECWLPLPGRRSSGWWGSLQGRQWPCSPYPHPSCHGLP